MVVVGLTHPVLFGFVRIGTNARAFVRPMSLAQASEHLASWLERRVTRVLQPGADHIRQVFDLLRDAGSSGGNLVTDAQVAALATAYGGKVHTADHDFERFAVVECRFPLDAR